MDSVPNDSGTPLPKVTLPIQSSGKLYVRAVTPGLRKLLYVVFGLVALLGANSLYLVAITALEAASKQTYQNYFYQLMFLGHLVLGLLLIVPLVLFGVKHMLYAKDRRNRRAVKVGYVLFATSLVVLVTGLLLMRISGFELKQQAADRTEDQVEDRRDVCRCRGGRRRRDGADALARSAQMECRWTERRCQIL